MKRRDFIKLTGAGLVAISMCSGRKYWPQRHPPNLLFVFPDQMRGSAMGFLGEEPVNTHMLDQFARESVVLPEAVSTYPLCSPARATLMTGQYPHKNGVLQNCRKGRANQLSVNTRCWSDVLADKGYSLGYIGKWHLDAPHPPYILPNFKWNEWCPPHRRHGFDFWYGYGGYSDHFQPLYWGPAAARDEYHFVKQWGAEHDADMAIRYIRNEDGLYRKENQPFALVVSINPPHPPYSKVPKKYVKPYEEMSLEDLCSRPNIPPATFPMGKRYRKNIRYYYAAISGVDEQFGRILRTLDEAGLVEDTIVVFTSDHGDLLGIHNKRSKNNIYEESFRVPFLIRWPGHLQPGSNSLLFASPDVYPTLLGLMGFKDNIPSSVQGTDYSSALLGQMADEPEGQLYYGPGAIRHWGWRNERYKLEVIRHKADQEVIRLFDRVNDPYELENIALQNDALVQQLRIAMNRKLQEIGDPWAPNLQASPV